MTEFGVHRDTTLKELTARAVENALSDAGATTTDVEAVFFGNSTQGRLEGQHSIRGQVALRPLGLTGVPVTNVENACATGSTALHHAVVQVRGGAYDVVLAVGAEKMNVGDRRARHEGFTGGFDVSDPDAVRRTLNEIGGDHDDTASGPRSVFTDIYAAHARGHMRLYGTTQRQLAMISAKNHDHAATNPYAHYRQPMSVDEVLSGRPLSYPLTVPMCAPVTDGAAAALVCSPRGLDRLRANQPVAVLACELGSGTDHDWHDWSQHITARTSLRAYARARIAPADISVAEVHDATAFGELLQSELLGFCGPGEGGALVESGATRLGGRIPINPSGGLESKGHPLSATGLGQVFELVQQLRGSAGSRQVQGARYALAENGGGFLGTEEAAAVVTILGRTE